MLTIDRQLKNKPTYIEMKSANNQTEKDRWVEKLGGSIQSCISRLKQLRVEIQMENRLHIIAQKMAEFEKVSNQYNQLQTSLAEIDEDSELCRKIRQINSDFLETYDPAELKKKLDHMKAQKTEQIKSQKLNEMVYVNEQQQQLTGELLYADKYAVRKRIIEQDKADLEEIERLITVIKDIATKTSIMINQQGETIKLTLEKMKKVNLHLQQGNKNLRQANEYQQDTNKKFLIFCCLTVVVVSIVLLILFASKKKHN